MGASLSSRQSLGLRSARVLVPLVLVGGHPKPRLHSLVSSAFWALALADDPVLTQSWRAHVDVRFGTIAEVPRDGVPGASRRTASGLI
jgi:hypothetical protein